ncbi:MAG: M20 family peptidase [Rhodoferax sp.]|nr:M20 family peptidase [Rhodoferax sp.]
MIKRLLLGTVALLLLLVVVLAVNTLRKGSRQLDVPALALLEIDKAGVSARLGEAVRARTVASLTDPAQNADQFEQLHGMLKARYPKVHSALKREVINQFSLLYTWPGSDPRAPPILLMAHQDVVPISPGSEQQWSVDPFSGILKDGFIWGRGAWDDKGNLIAQMEAVEMLLSSGYQPKRTVYLAYGADEEISGERGAARIAALLKQRGVRLAFVIDEGLLITEGIIPGLSKPAALIGVAEKGYLSVVVKVPGTPGHSSMPPPKNTSAIAVMGHTLQQIDNDQMPAHIRGIAAEMFASLAPEMDGFARVALSNLWLFGPIVQKQLEAGASTNALLRTTTALTMVNAGNADNVMPGEVSATINYRMLPGDSAASILQRLKAQVAKTLGNARFELVALPNGSEASTVSPTESAPYQLINRTVREVFPGTLVAPGLMIGATDSRHFSDISDHIFRFSPVRAKVEDLARFHGSNERISADNLAELIRFYHRFLTIGAQAP